MTAAPTPPTAAQFRGPYADGPPTSALLIDAPPLDEFRIRDLGRMVTVVAVLVWSIVVRVVRSLVQTRRPRWTTSASDGLIDAFIRLGPTTVKAGQIIASAGPVVPEPLAVAARRCLDAVPPFPVAHVHEAIADDLGRPFGELFAAFDDEPLSAASIGQVHACTLADGRNAVVKVQRPGIWKQMATDLRIGYRIAAFIEWTPWGRFTNAKEIVADLHSTTFQELNPTHEAWQQDRFRANIWAFGDNDLITTPEVYWDHCGPRVICMERVHGIPMDSFDEMDRRGIDGQTILRLGAKVWAESVMVHGPFHGDMHAGNIWVLDDGRGCYLDFGIMGELPDEWKEFLKDLFYTCVFDLDFGRVARAYRRVGIVPAEFGSDEDLAAMLERIMGPALTGGFGNLDIVALVTQSVDLLKSYQAIAPRELALVAKQLLYVDKYVRYLAPTYSLTADPFIVKNIFPDDAEVKAAEIGLDLDDPSALPPTATVGTAAAEPDPAPPPPPTTDGDTMRHAFLSPEWIDTVRAIRDEYQPMVDEAVATGAVPDGVPSGGSPAEGSPAEGSPVEGSPAEGSPVEAAAQAVLADGLPTVTVNLNVTDMPDGADDVAAHATTAGGQVELELDHLPDADLTVIVDHDTLKAMVVDQDPQAAMAAFMSGKIRIDGDMGALLGGDTNPLVLLQSLDLSGGTLSDVDPTLAAVAERIKAITA